MWSVWSQVINVNWTRYDPEEAWRSKDSKPKTSFPWQVTVTSEIELANLERMCAQSNLHCIGSASVKHPIGIIHARTFQRDGHSQPSVIIIYPAWHFGRQSSGAEYKYYMVVPDHGKFIGCWQLLVPKSDLDVDGRISLHKHTKPMSIEPTLWVALDMKMTKGSQELVMLGSSRKVFTRRYMFSSQ